MRHLDKRIVFMGTPDISAGVLKGLFEAGLNIVGVVAQPDRPVGRKKILEPVPTKKVALEHNVPVFQPEKIKNDYNFLVNLKPDLIITLAYGQIVPQSILDIPAFGCLNLHGSLLPKYRGAAPIQYALMNNDHITGMSLMRMVKAMDAGEVYDVEKIVIDENDNCTSLFFKMERSALTLILRNIDNVFDNKLVGIPQNEEEVSFSPSIKPEEERININNDVENAYGLIRALSDKPGAYLYLNGVKIKIFKANIIKEDLQVANGTIVKADKTGFYVKFKNGLLSVLELQKEGKNRMDFKSFINGNPNLEGQKVE